MNPLDAILEQFALQNAQIVPLENTFNQNFRVAANGKTYLLRQHRDPRHNIAALESEMLWLQHLSAFGLEVQQPQPLVRQQQSQPLVGQQQSQPLVGQQQSQPLVGQQQSQPLVGQQQSQPLENGSFICVANGKPYSLLSWLEGEVFEVTETTEQAKVVGELMARLHLAAESFVPPTGFTRLHYDAEFLITTLQKLENIAWLAPEMPLYRAALEYAEPAFTQPQSTLIHADLHAGNLLWRGQTVMALDFDACGFGALGFDLATALGYLETEVRDVFLEGYESLHPLPADFLEQKRRYTIAEWLNNLSFLAPRDHEREYVETVMVQGLREQLPRLIQP